MLCFPVALLPLQPLAGLEEGPCARLLCAKWNRFSGLIILPFTHPLLVSKLNLMQSRRTMESCDEPCLQLRAGSVAQPGSCSVTLLSAAVHP